MRSYVIPEIFKQFEDAGVQYCHWKSTDHLEAAYEAKTDLDVLVGRMYSERAEFILRGLGFVELATAYLRSYPGVKDFVFFDQHLDRFIHFHLHYQLVLGDRWVKATHLPIEEKILANSVRSSEYKTFIVSPVDELLLLLSRMPLKFANPFVDAKVLEEASILRSRVDDLPRGTHFPEEVYAVAEYYLSSGKFLSSDADKIRKSMRPFLRFSLVGFKFISFVRYIYRVFVEINRRKLSKYNSGRRSIREGGVVVAFVGPDGCGKTSSVFRNSKFFSQQINVDTVFMGSGRSGASFKRKMIFLLADRLANLKRKSVRLPVGSNDSLDRKPKAHTTLKCLWDILSLRDKLKRLSVVQASKAAGSLTLVDRWPQETVSYVLDGRRYSPKGNYGFFGRIAASLEELFSRCRIVQPDLVFVFKVSPEVAQARKPDEVSIEKSKELSQCLEEIVWDSGVTVRVVDADMPITDVDHHIRTEIWNFLKGGSVVL